MGGQGGAGANGRSRSNPGKRAGPAATAAPVGPADLDGVVAGRSSHLGTGGMASKVSAALLAADALVLLSDIDGLYDWRPAQNRGRDVHSGGVRPADLDGVVAGRSSHLGTGGMASKVSAALLAADGFGDLRGDDVAGTHGAAGRR